jgi:hypothetical protein
MKLAPLTLEGYFAEHFEVAANPKYDLKQPLQLRIDDLHVDTHVDYLPRSDVETEPGLPVQRAQVRLGIRYKPTHEGNFPYSFQLDLVGSFAVPFDLKDIEPHRLLELNGSSILYGVAREMIASFTSRGPHSYVLLPSISFPAGGSAVSGTSTVKRRIENAEC